MKCFSCKDTGIIMELIGHTPHKCKCGQYVEPVDLKKLIAEFLEAGSWYVSAIEFNTHIEDGADDWEKRFRDAIK